MYSENVFKRDPGIGGVVLKSATTEPIPGVTAEIYDSSGKLVASLVTDINGWFMWQFKMTGKAADYTVKLPAYGLSQTVTLKANGYAIVNFSLP